MGKKTIYTTEETEDDLKAIGTLNGTSHSASIRIAVKQYRDKLTDESAEFIKALKPGRKLGSKNKPKEIIKGE